MSNRILSITLLLISVWMCVHSVAGNYRRHHKRFPPPCCTAVVSDNSTSQVIGDTYRRPKATPPCVDAVIFNTAKGPACFDPTALWVQKLTSTMKKN